MADEPCYSQDSDSMPLTRLIYHTAQDMKNLAEKILSPHDLTIEQFQPLKIISFATGITQRQIGDRCHKSAANLTRILDRLQKKNLIERRINPQDRRVSLVFLTHQGQALVREVSDILDGLTVKILAKISDADQQVLRHCFKQISNNLQSLDAQHQAQ